MSDSRSVAMSIYDSEVNALAANELAAAFVAEYLTDRPDQGAAAGQRPPRNRCDGGCSTMGANLIEDMNVGTASSPASAFTTASIRPVMKPEIVRLLNDGFLPIHPRERAALSATIS